MKKIILPIVILLLFFSFSIIVTANTAYESEAAPHYEKAVDVKSKLKVNNTTAVCDSAAIGNKNVESITAVQTLEKQGFLWFWSACGDASWTETAQSNILAMSNAKYGLESGNYRLKTVFTLTDKSGDTETVTVMAEKTVVDEIAPETKTESETKAPAETTAEPETRTEANTETAAETDENRKVPAEALPESERYENKAVIRNFLVGIRPPTDNTPDDFDYINTGGEYPSDRSTNISCHEGDNVYAVQNGSVICAEFANGFGYCVRIDHGNGTITQYAHLSEILAQVGGEVKAGDVIGKAGISGAAKQPCVGYCFSLSGEEDNAERKDNRIVLEGYLNYDDLKKLSREERVEYFRSAGTYDYRLYFYPDEILPNMHLPLDEKYLPYGWEFNCSKLYADAGSDIYCIADGTVLYAGEYGRYLSGNVVVIGHENGYYTMYQCLRDIYVKTGQRVESGDVIASLGDFTYRKKDTSHLIFDIYKGEEPITMPADGALGIKEFNRCLKALKEDIANGTYKDNEDLLDYYNKIF